MAYTRYVGPKSGETNGGRLQDRGSLPETGDSNPNTGDELPLSFGQLRLWFLDQLEPGSAIYNMPMALRLKGAIDISALGKALQVIVERHPSLRTRFVCSGEYPQQVIEENVQVDIPVVDLKDEPEAKREFKASQLIREEINRPFNLGSDFPLRLKLLRLGAESHILIVTMHHIASDEWSLRIFFHELGEYYSAFSQGRDLILPPPAIQYTDYASGQRERMQGQLLQKQVDFWKQSLAEEGEVFELPTDRPRGGLPSFRGAFSSRALNEKVVHDFKEVARKHRVTGFMAHLAAFYALLFRCVRRTDVTVGCPIAGRDAVEIEGVVGFFVNTLLLRLKLDDNPTFSDLLKRVRALTLDALEHQELPVEKLIEELQPERSLNHLPFTRVMFAVQNESFEPVSWAGVEVEYLDVATDTSKFDFTLLIQEGAKGGIARAEFNTDLFDRTTVERLLEYYENLVADVAANPAKRLSELELLGEDDKDTLLLEWNATQTNYPRAKCVHQIFEEVAGKSPKTTAVEFGSVSLTYGELNARANQLAHYLAQFKIGPDSPVAICVERSADLIVAMLGVLKAGGAYVPLDPDYPTERLEYMLRDTGSPIWLTQQLLVSRLPQNGVKPICLDSDWELIGRESAANPASTITPDRLAYVMYTSGSTGSPKGVAIPQRGITRLVLNTNYVTFTPEDRVAQVSNAAFDAATFEVWGALLNGGRLIGFSSDVILSPVDFAREIRGRRISKMFLTAALFNQMAAEQPGAFSDLDTLIVGGEALDPKWIRKVLRNNPPRRLLNGYGPTENTTFTCCHLIQDLDAEQKNIPIGRPVSNTQVYILDANLKPTPIGIPGELYTGGDGLARGYWHQPEITAERFIANPFEPLDAMARLYKTGDLARFLPNGDVEYLGRLDNQVKVRGFRIELGEIEATLRRHPGVDDCVVKVFGAGAENKRLVAYYAGDEKAPNVSELRSFLQKSLPEHMLPSAFVALPAIPLTPNGKVNRNGLPEPDQARPSLERTYTAPTDDTETRLVNIWQTVLGVSPIGVQDKFFELGGHSLLAVRLVAAMEREFGRKLKLSTIFQAPTIQDLAAILRDEVNETAITDNTSVVEIHAAGTKKPIFFVHGAGGGMFWGYTNLSRHLGTDQPVYAFRARGLTGREEFERVEDMAREYVRDLQAVQPSGPYYLGGYCFGGNVAYEMARQLVNKGEEIGMLALLNCSPPNSCYTNIRVNPSWMMRFAKNLLYWGDYFRQWTTPQRRAFFRWKWDQLKKKFHGLTDSFSGGIRGVDVGDLVDLSSFTEEERRVWESHIHALIKYYPQPFAGKVHLFRSPGHPMWCSFDADYGWGELAREGVEVTIVPGAHEKVLEEPCVQTVASALGRLLTETQKNRVASASSSGISQSRKSACSIGESNLAYWKRQLQGAPALLELSTDFPRPAAQSCRGGSDQVQIPAAVASKIHELSGALGVEDKVIFHSALAVLLQRYTRQDDIPVCVMTTAHGTSGELENPVILRTSLEDDPLFVEFVKKAALAWKDASAHAGLPFEELVDEIQATRDQSYHPLAQVLFDYRRKVDGSESAQTLTKFDLEFLLRDTGKGVDLQLRYAQDLFEARTIRRVLEHFNMLVGGIAANPHQKLSELPVLTEAEKRILLSDWTATERPYPADKTLADLFEEQVARTPDAEALICGHERLTYRELHRRACVVAQRLNAVGVRPDDLVGICIERSWEMLASILGTLIAGAAYVPMDPTYPKDRLAFILEDADIKVLFTQQKLNGTLDTKNARVVCVEDINWSETSTDVFGANKPRASANSLAYVIYTSGSTGRPKGVALEHQSAVAFVYWAKDVFTTEELSGVLASTSICFDLSIYEFFVPLGLGGKIILAENALALASLPAANEVRLVNTVPSAARELVRVKGIPASVSVINLAGEPLPTLLVDALYAQTSIKKVYDLYGPTETTTYSTFTLRQPGKRATIGKPLANEQVYLLDQRQEPVPIGVVGELYIGGDGLARGYLNRPQMTAERFIADRFTPGKRMYRTGDLARWRSDGNLEFLGRIDNQVKVRGFRIELGEIESVLRRQPGVSEAVVLAREDQPGQKRLVAYVAATKDATPTSDELRAAIRKSLPEYMTPATFVFLKAMPLTPNGKVDRKSLPAPAMETISAEGEANPPRTPTEEKVAAAWSEVLQLKGIGVAQNFFELGGDSLQAIQVISRVQEQFNLNLPLSCLFDAPTIETLAAGIDAGRWADRKVAVAPLCPFSRSERLPVSFVQERLWFFNQLLPESRAYNVPAAWKLSGPLNIRALENAINQMVHRHESLRTVFKYEQGELSQVIVPEMNVAVRFEDAEVFQPVERENRIRELYRAKAAFQFDLAHGPLLDVTVVKAGADEHLLLLAMHHTISDGWSLGVFARELGILYQAAMAGNTSPQLPPLPVQYADFACWQRNNLAGETLKAEATFWKRKLAGAPAALQLPTDHPEPARQSFKAAYATLQIGELLNKSRSDAGGESASTPFHTLMAALITTLHKWTGQQDIVVGTVVAGRNRTEIENVIGCFMNFLPIRVKLSGEETAGGLLNDVRTALVEAQNHQDYPFEKMVEAINPERSVNRNPLYNVALLFQNFPMPRVEGGGIVGVPQTVNLEEATLDLRFEAEQNEKGISIMCEYKTDLFEAATIDRLLGSLETSVKTLVEEPGKKISELQGVARAVATTAVDTEKRVKIAVASTFTAEPIAEPLRYWIKELEIPAEVDFALFNQVFQELLDPSSLMMRNEGGLNVILLRFADWRRASTKSGKNGAENSAKDGGEELVERSIQDFVLAMRNASGKGGTSWLVCVCPDAPGDKFSERGWHARMEHKLANELEGLSGVYLLSSSELANWYPVVDYYDPSADELGHIPYTPTFFTALATAITRKYHALKRPVYKVIALDCDNTLWGGVCGEDGAKGIRLDAGFVEMQKFMRAQQEAGLLLCAVSKNNEADVRDVFEQRTEMPLRPEQFASWRLNWQPKSANLKSLAEELKLGLDSFIFLDDNPVECAEVQANCPEVLTLQLPTDPAQLPQFLKHCWVFDHLKLTAEDRQRGEMYRQNKEREQLRAQSLSLNDFLASLELRITIEPMSESQVSRASQLTHRTNQFNFTTKRRSESDLRELAGTAQVLTVSVSDRFGDYGLAGLIIYSAQNGALDMETFLLSCRVLGRGVEHRMLAHLGQLAQQNKLNWVDVHFSVSEKNRPGFDFLENVGAAFRQAQNGGYLFRFPAGFAADVSFDPQMVESKATNSSNGETKGQEQTAAESVSSDVGQKSELRIPRFTRCREIALEFNDPASIHEIIEAKSVVHEGKRIDFVPPQNELERKLCAIWQKLLRVEKVGVHDNFFELGGHSLLAVRLFTEIETAAGRKLPLVTLFQSPTVRELARILDQSDSVSRRSLLVPLQPLGDKPPLFLVHGAGGDVLWGYANLTAHLAADQPVYGIKSKGQSGEEEFSRIEDMAACYVQQIKAHQPHGPYYLGGYCFGGNVAFEMARQLKGQGEIVGLVALLDAAPSNAGYEKMTWWRPGFIFRFASNLSHWLRDFSELKSADRRKFVTRKFSALGRKLARRFSKNRGASTVDLEDVIDPTHFPENELKLWQIHLQALIEHIERPFDGQVLLLRTRGQPLFCSLEQDFRWGKLARRGVNIVITPGSHENIFMEPNVKALAGHLQSALSTVQSAK